MKFHFAAVVCTDWDFDLLSHWIPRYQNMVLDTYTVFINSPTGENERFQEAWCMFRTVGWNVIPVYGSYTAAFIRGSMLGRFQKDLPGDDVLVTIDSDEILMITGPRIREAFDSEYDVMGGELIDRYDHVLHDANPDIPLTDQYPFSGDVQNLILTKNPEVAGRMKLTIKEKIIASRCRVYVNHEGAHPSQGHGRQYTIMPGISDIYHYSWRSTALERVAAKPYNTAEYVWYLGKMFGIPDEELRVKLARKIEESVELQTAKGWM